MVRSTLPSELFEWQVNSAFLYNSLIMRICSLRTVPCFVGGVWIRSSPLKIAGTILPVMINTPKVSLSYNSALELFLLSRIMLSSKLRFWNNLFGHFSNKIASLINSLHQKSKFCEECPETQQDFLKLKNHEFVLVFSWKSLWQKLSNMLITVLKTEFLKIERLRRYCNRKLSRKISHVFASSVWEM